MAAVIAYRKPAGAIGVAMSATPAGTYHPAAAPY